MEQDEGAQYVIQNSRSYADIDNTIDLFVEKFLQEFAYDLPGAIFKNQQTDTLFPGIDEYESKRALAKKIFQAYSTKGSEAAIRLLFRLLFDDEITFYYPKDDILKTSDGLWQAKKTIKVFSPTGNTSIIERAADTIRGTTSNATAIVDVVYSLGAEYTGLSVYELKLETDSLNGTFTGNETITFSSGNLVTGATEITGTATVLNVISSFTLTDPGYGYVGGEAVAVTGSGQSYSGAVAAVGPGGKIRRISTTNFGARYNSVSATTMPRPATVKLGKFDLAANVITATLVDGTGNVINHGLNVADTINVSFTTGLTSVNNGLFTVLEAPSIKKIKFGISNSLTVSGTLSLNSRQAVLTPVIGTICNYYGEYDGVRGQLDNSIKVQDSYYYQDYSYVIRTEQQSVYWKDIVKKVLHPAGMELFAEVFLSTSTDIVSVDVKPKPGRYETFIIFIQNLLERLVVTPKFRTIVELSVYNRAARDLGRYQIGPTYNTIEQFKFFYDNLGIYGIGNIAIQDTTTYVPFIIAPPGTYQTANLNSTANILLNSSFTDTSAWTVGTGWAITNGNASGTAATGILSQTNLPVVNRAVYSIKYDVTTVSAGNVAIGISSGDYNYVTTPRTATGSYTDYIFLNSNVNTGLANANIIGSSFTGNVDNVTINLVGNWNPNDPVLEPPNILPVQSDLSNAAWTKFNSTVALTGISSPTGTTDVYKVVESAGSSAHGVYQTFSGATGVSYKYSVYAKALERNFLAINLESDIVYFNLTTGTIGTVGGSITSPSIISMGNGWYRCSAVKTMVGGVFYVEYDIASADNTYVYNGDGTSGLYLWGAKVNVT
jgi:hypothetical protein